ncbi:hypothetical protein Y032_0072g692 [Ancylostoma ceylanicum]|nr:hypothetical protein Y032_0072g692 [Ancylostoma ceylanicum]
METLEGPQLFRSSKKICHIHSNYSFHSVRRGGAINDSSRKEKDRDLGGETRANLPSVDCSTCDIFDVI